jgi:hypothetical protein
VRTLALFVVFGGLAAVAASYMLQTRSSDLPLVEPIPPTSSMPQPVAPSEQPEPASERVGGEVRGTSRPAPFPIDGRLAQIERMTGESIAAYLQERGLSKVDSERIVADVSKPFAECVNQAMTTLEALTQTAAVSLQDHLDAVGAKLTTCQVNAAQQTGIPLSVLQDALRGAVMASPPGGAEQ